MAGLNRTDLRIPKTIKLFIGGEFPRTESGRVLPITHPRTGALYGNLCRASRKDLREAVTAARSAQPGWEARSAYNRGQILYRMAEMMEGKRLEFVETLVDAMGLEESAAHDAVDTSIDSLVYFAGFADKFSQLMGSTNPVSGPHHCFTTPEAVGVVGFLADPEFSLGRFVARLAAILCPSNTVIALLPPTGAAVIAPLAEVLATSDLPKGAVNLLSGEQNELVEQFGSHMEIDAVNASNQDGAVLARIRELGVENMKRVIERKGEDLGLEPILDHMEFKTVWHPVGY